MDIKRIRSLAQVMESADLTLLEIVEDCCSLKMERKGETIVAPAPAATPVAVSVASSVSADTVETEETVSSDLITVTSPTVGVFYAAPSPDSKNFVEVGDQVKKGDVLCVIEAMKLMNEITAEQDGVIVEICVGNKQVVEYGQPLLRMR
ncbi:MAG: acetyl-CoA carboxylase biotin carboxyl carrier protein [Bacillota bacterium]|nr:acetyl-CoA carboxylase biotin carboxyl carrier protein [Bacillota bacterium]